VTAGWVVAVCVAVATVAVAVAVLVRARPVGLGDAASGRVDPERVQREALRQDREDVERDALGEHFAAAAAILQPDHEVLPDKDDFWREVALDYLERMWALPAAERAL
jgi:hypothetical protein